MKNTLSLCWWIVLKQVSAALYGLLLIVLIIFSAYVDIPFLERYDFLFLGAILIQVILVATKLESIDEVKTIFLFHVVATIMEIFKTSEHIGSWVYPDEAFFRIENVPLFTGFMYSAVGSYLARTWNLFQITFPSYPPFIHTVLLALLAYINFFSHHYVPDIRILLFVYAGVLFGWCRMNLKIQNKTIQIPFFLALFGSAFLIWVAENIGTFYTIWLYPNQINEWQMVSWQKLGSWFLLIIVSFVLVSLSKQKFLGSPLKRT